MLSFSWNLRGQNDTHYEIIGVDGRNSSLNALSEPYQTEPSIRCYGTTHVITLQSMQSLIIELPAKLIFRYGRHGDWGVSSFSNLKVGHSLISAL